MAGPLQNIRVLDLSTVLMGPYACEVLAEHGADVIKVEELGGEVGRQVGPGRSPGMRAAWPRDRGWISANFSRASCERPRTA